MANLTAIQTERLTKFYGAQCGIEDLDLSVKVGEVFGLLGPNGAGKTTTIRLLLDFIRPTAGSATVLGYDIRAGSKEIRRRTGYLPGDFATYRNLTATGVFEYFDKLRGVRSPSTSDLCDRFNLDAGRKIGELSRGNRQKVGLVQAYMSNPDLLVLDEPTTGLDPLLQIEFQKLVAERKASGATQFISSHLLSEVEAVCDRVGIIRDGRLVAVETLEAMRARSVQRVEITFADEVPLRVFSSIPGVAEAVSRNGHMQLTVTGDMDPIIKAAARHTVLSFTSEAPSLDEVFLAYYTGDDEDEERGEE